MVRPNRAMCGCRRRSTASQRTNPAASNCCVHHRYDAMVTCPSTRSPLASRLEVVFVDRPVEVGAERVELGDAVLAHLALEPSGWPARVRTERRDRRDDPTSAHPPQVLECPRQQASPARARASRARSRRRTTRSGTAAASSGQPGARRARPHAARARPPIDSRRRPRRRHRARGAPRPRTRARIRRRALGSAGKKRHSRYAATSAFDVARVYCS